MTSNFVNIAMRNNLHFPSNHNDSSSSSSTGSSSPETPFSKTNYDSFLFQPTITSPTKTAQLYFQKNHNHHHHSIQELFRHLGKKMQNWRTDGRDRRSSCSEDSPKQNEEFRSRSKSLDCYTKPPKNVSDCETTYRIFNTILKEGKIFFLI